MDETAETLIIIDSLVSNGRLHAVDTALALGLNVIFVCSAVKDYQQVELTTYHAHSSFHLVEYCEVDESAVLNKLDALIGEAMPVAVSNLASKSSQGLAKNLCGRFQLRYRKQEVLAVVIAAGNNYQFSKAYELYCPSSLRLKSALEQTITIQPVSLFSRAVKQGGDSIQRITSLLPSAFAGPLLL